MKKRFQGREFEYLFRQDTKIILWGSANIGLRFLDFYAKHLNIVKLCDGSTEKVGTQVGYMMVSDPSEIVYDESTVVIVTCSFYQEIRPILEAKGFRHHVSLFYYDDFEEIYRLYIHGKLCSHRIDISLTERCTLKCRDCNMWMTHFREPKEQPVEDVLNDIDLYFSTVDFVREMELLGGEPLLYADIAKVFRYVREVYTERVGKLVLFTNGTLLPSQELLELMRDLDVSVMLSDYTQTVPYAKRFAEFQELLNRYDIYYFAPPTDEWADFGFPSNPADKNDDEMRLQKKFSECAAPFRGLYQGKVFFCHLETSAIRAGLFPFVTQDAFSLTDDDAVNRKDRFLEFDMGYTENGYIEFCKVCRGCDCVNDLRVPIGVQVKV